MNRFGKFALFAFVLPAGSLAAAIANAAPGTDAQNESMTQQSQHGTEAHGSITTDGSDSDRPLFGESDRPTENDGAYDDSENTYGSEGAYSDSETTYESEGAYSDSDRMSAGEESMQMAGGSKTAEYMSTAPSDSVRVDKIVGSPLHVRSADNRMGDDAMGDDEIGNTGIDDPSDDLAELSNDDRFGTDRENQKEIGEISDLIIDERGHVVAVVVDIGGFLGMGQHPVAISWDSIERRLNADNDGYEFTVNATEEELRQAPAFDEESDGIRVSSETTD